MAAARYCESRGVLIAEGECETLKELLERILALLEEERRLLEGEEFSPELLEENMSSLAEAFAVLRTQLTAVAVDREELLGEHSDTLLRGTTSESGAVQKLLRQVQLLRDENICCALKKQKVLSEELKKIAERKKFVHAYRTRKNGARFIENLF